MSLPLENGLKCTFFQQHSQRMDLGSRLFANMKDFEDQLQGSKQPIWGPQAPQAPAVLTSWLGPWVHTSPPMATCRPILTKVLRAVCVHVVCKSLPHSPLFGGGEAGVQMEASRKCTEMVQGAASQQETLSWH